MNIMNVTISGKQIAATTATMLEATKDLPDDAVILSSLALALTISNPNLTIPQLAAGVKLLSEHLVMWLSTQTPTLSIN